MCDVEVGHAIVWAHYQCLATRGGWFHSHAKWDLWCAEQRPGSLKVLPVLILQPYLLILLGAVFLSKILKPRLINMH